MKLPIEITATHLYHAENDWDFDFMDASGTVLNFTCHDSSQAREVVDLINSAGRYREALHRILTDGFTGIVWPETIINHMRSIAREALSADPEKASQP